MFQILNRVRSFILTFLLWMPSYSSMNVIISPSLLLLKASFLQDRNLSDNWNQRLKPPAIFPDSYRSLLSATNVQIRCRMGNQTVSQLSISVYKLNLSKVSSWTWFRIHCANIWNNNGSRIGVRDDKGGLRPVYIVKKVRIVSYDTVWTCFPSERCLWIHR